MLGDFRAKPKPKWQWVLWWRIDEDDLQDQVDRYDTLGWFEAARKLSVVCLLFSIAVTIVTSLIGATGAESYADAALMALLAIFIYWGHRWAMIVAMVLWTVGKVLIAVRGLDSHNSPNAGALVVSFFWWAAYMHAFYLAFRVEQKKRKQPAVSSGS